MATWLATSTWIVGFSFAFLGAHIIDLRFRDKWAPLLIVSCLIIASRYQAVMTMRRHLNTGILALVAWALLSSFWAPQIVFVLTQAISFIAVVTIAIAFSITGWRHDRFERQLAWTIAALLVWSGYTAVMSPEIGVSQGTDISLFNAWRGVTFQKNALGQLSAVGLIVWTYLWASRRLQWAVSAIGMALSVYLLINSRSSTSLMLALISCAIIVLILRPTIGFGPTLRRTALGTVYVLVPIGVFLAVATPYLGFIGALFGKDGTFSGRTYIWQGMIDEIVRHPLLGTGLSSFWDGKDPGEARMQAIVGWPVRNAHNGYLEVTNELGLVGLALFMVFLVSYCLALARLSRISRPHYALHLSLFLYLVLANISESGWFSPISPTHLIGMYASIEISRLLFEDALIRRQAAPARAPPDQRLA